MSSRVPAALAAAALAIALTPAVARADQVITAQVVWHFDAMSYTIDQGEKLFFKNADSVSPGMHNVTAATNGPDNGPLFKSDTIPGDGTEVPVVGAQQLTHGQYTFMCTIHPFMQATLTVTDKGTPLPPPGSGSPPQQQPQAQQPAQAPPRDTTRPRIHATLRPVSLRRALRTGSLLARITTSELVSLRVDVVARVRGRTVTLATESATDGAPRRPTDFTARLTAAGRRALRSARRLAVTLVVRATDTAGNTTTTRTRRNLRR